MDILKILLWIAGIAIAVWLVGLALEMTFEFLGFVWAFAPVIAGLVAFVWLWDSGHDNLAVLALLVGAPLLQWLWFKGGIVDWFSSKT